MSSHNLLYDEGSGRPGERLQLGDSKDFSQVRFMESYESKHSDHSFTAALAAKLGVTQSPLRLDSQAKYGKFTAHRRKDVVLCAAQISGAKKRGPPRSRPPPGN